MTEQKLAPGLPKPSKRRSFRLIGAALLLVVAALVLFRQHVAGSIAQAICAGQSLNCKLKVSRFDFGGLTFSNLEIRNPKAPNPALTAQRLAIDLNWGFPFSPRPTLIGGDDIVVRFDLSGARPILGDLDAAVKNFTKGGGEPGPIPRLDFKTVRLIGDTVLGPVEARGTVVATGADAFEIALTAPPAKLGLYGADLELTGANLTASVKGGAISARATFGLARFKVGESTIDDVKMDVSLEQAAGVLRGNGSASLGTIALDDTKLARAEAKATVESAAVDPAAFDFDAWIANVRKLSLTASAGAGSLGDIKWTKGALTALVEPRAAGGSGGDVTFDAASVKIKQGAADALKVTGTMEFPAGGRPHIAGEARLTGAALDPGQRADLANAVSDPFEAALPTFAAALKRAADSAGQGFTLTAPWSVTQTATGYDISALSGTRIRAASGFTLTADANATRSSSPTSSPTAPAAITWSTDEGGRWRAEGSLRLSGGGAPTVSVDLARASGTGEVMSIAGAARLHEWRVGDDVLAAEATGLQLDTTAKGGAAAGQLTLRLDGGLAGGVWKAARATGQIKTAWDRDRFYADAPKGLVIQWDEGRYGGTVLGASALYYTPKGRLADQKGKATVGEGSIAKISLPVTADGYSAKASLGATTINWRAEGGVRIGFDTDPTTVDLKWAERDTPVSIEDMSGILDLRDGWRVTGQFKGANAKAAEANIADLRGKFDLGGAGGDLDGAVTDIAMRIFDPNSPDTRRYEEEKFEGKATLKDSVAEFSGLFTLAKPTIQVASITGLHSLKTGNGSLTFAPTPLLFQPGAFQPFHLSPILRGPSGVIGRIDLGGGASWTASGVKTNAIADIRSLGFSLASAGVFEGVAGKVVISDLINMKSDPGQTITLGKVTLGLPIEKGTVKFQLIGYDAIRIEGAEWPFVGGFLRVKPTDFKFGQDENLIVAQADKWNLNSMVEQFKIPDVKLAGTVSGDIPVVFSTGSATIDNAVLQASQDGGVIQFLGSVGEAAAQSDQNAKMLFDALKDFHYQVLKVGVNGDITGRVVLSLDLLGRNPTVLDGAQFQLGISIDGALMDLANKAQGRFSLGDTLRGGVTAKDTVKDTAPGAPN